MKKTYKVVYEKNAIKSLRKLDVKQRKYIFQFIKNKLNNTENPRQMGKALKGNLKEYWRYRVGDYRLIAEINDEEIRIIIFEVGHRKDIYNK